MNPIRYIARFHREHPMTFWMTTLSTFIYGTAIADTINNNVSRGIDSYELFGGAVAMTAVTYAVKKIEDIFEGNHNRI